MSLLTTKPDEFLISGMLLKAPGNQSLNLLFSALSIFEYKVPKCYGQLIINNMIASDAKCSKWQPFFWIRAAKAGKTCRQKAQKNTCTLSDGCMENGSSVCTLGNLNFSILLFKLSKFTLSCLKRKLAIIMVNVQGLYFNIRYSGFFFHTAIQQYFN